MKRLIVAALLIPLGCAVAEAEDWLCVTPNDYCVIGEYERGAPCTCNDQTGVAVTVLDGYIDQATEYTPGDVCYTSVGQCFIAPSGVASECDCDGFPGLVGIQW
jgi:hypothetical protein